jgi:putative transcriptional regulator
MAAKARFKSKAFEAIHGSAVALHRVGAMDMATMRAFDEASLVAPQALTPADIKRIRTTAKVSQPVFARYLNTSESTVEKWETGAKKPSGMALRLLTVVRKRGLEVLA